MDFYLVFLFLAVETNMFIEFVCRFFFIWALTLTLTHTTLTHMKNKNKNKYTRSTHCALKQLTRTETRMWDKVLHDGSEWSCTYTFTYDMAQPLVLFLSFSLSLVYFFYFLLLFSHDRL